MHQVSEQEKTQVRLQSVASALESGALLQVSQMLEFLHPAEVATLIESLPPRDRDLVWDMVPDDRQGDVLSYFNDEVRIGLMRQMASQEVAAVTETLEADDLADIMQDLPPDVFDDVLRAMDAQNRQRLAAVLSYPEDTAGGLMNTDVITVRADVTLDVVIRYLRRQGELPEKTDSLMVVDRENHFQGVLELSSVLTGAPDSLVRDVMDAGVEPIPAIQDQADVATIFEQRDLLSAPVVDEDGVLIGRITVDDVVDVIREQGDQSLLSMAGLDAEDDMFAPVVDSARKRALWLGVNLATAFLAAWVIGLFEATLEAMVALAVLMPVVASMGGIAGSQTLTLVIRGLALGHIGVANARWMLARELLVGLLNGAFWAVVVAGVAVLWFGDVQLGVIIGLAMIINLITAAFAGALIPIGLSRIHIDPALAGGVILTTVTDVIGFWAFLGLATVFLV